MARLRGFGLLPSVMQKAPKISSRLTLRGFGGTPEFKVEEGPQALSANSNTAFA